MIKVSVCRSLRVHLLLYLLGWHQIIQFDSSPSSLIWIILQTDMLKVSIWLSEKQRDSYCAVCSVGCLSLNFAVCLAWILVYSSFWSKQPIMQIALQSNIFSRFQMVFPPSPFYVCCALCVFLINQVNPQAMHHSVSHVSRKWTVILIFWGAFIF